MKDIQVTLTPAQYEQVATIIRLRADDTLEKALYSDSEPHLGEYMKGLIDLSQAFGKHVEVESVVPVYREELMVNDKWNLQAEWKIATENSAFKRFNDSLNLERKTKKNDDSYKPTEIRMVNPDGEVIASGVI